MSYFNFTKVAPVAPNDPFVDVNLHLNGNWDEIENKLNAITAMPNNVTNAEIGQEIYASATQRFLTWNGGSWNSPSNIDANWGAWQTLPLGAAVVARTGFTPQYRTSVALRSVELRGGLLIDAAADPWPAGLVVVTTGTSGIANTNGPIGSLSIQQTATGLPTSPAHGASGYVRIDVSGSWVRVQAQYAGGPGGGNFLQLDGVKWWY